MYGIHSAKAKLAQLIFGGPSTQHAPHFHRDESKENWETEEGWIAFYSCFPKVSSSN